jgi:hypothetical protein
MSRTASPILDRVESTDTDTPSSPSPPTKSPAFLRSSTRVDETEDQLASSTHTSNYVDHGPRDAGQPVFSQDGEPVLTYVFYEVNVTAFRTIQ